MPISHVTSLQGATAVLPCVVASTSGWVGFALKMFLSFFFAFFFLFACVLFFGAFYSFVGVLSFFCIFLLFDFLTSDFVFGSVIVCYA